MKNRKNQIQNGKEQSSHYVIRSESYLGCGNEKQLFFTSDGYQEGIVFYRDKEWADGFQLETGLELVEFN